MFPDICTNCQSDQISGPHELFSGLIGKPTITIKSKKLIGMNKSVKIHCYICLNCGEIKFLADKADLEKLDLPLEKPVVD